MSPAEQPGQNNPKPQGGADEVVSDADVEKTLGKLESMTATLVQEVGAPPAKADPGPLPEEDTPRRQQAAMSPLQAAAEAAAQAADAAERAAEKQAAADAADAAGAAPAAVEPAELPGTEAGVTPAAEPADQADPPAEQQTDASASAPDKGQTPGAGASEADGTATQAQIDQEINQALRQLQGGEPAATDAKASAEGAASPAAGSEAGLGRLCLRGLDMALTPIVLVLALLDLPFRWLPAALKQLLGYIAVGTALMAASLWVYILLRTH